MADLTDREYLLSVQYKDETNLSARFRLHQEFSTNPYGLMPWIFDRFDLPAAARILDVGGGPGDLWLENRPRIPPGWQIIHSDLSLQMIWKAQENLGRTLQVRGHAVLDAQSLPVPCESFDAVVANFMLYHVPDRPRALVEIRRVLKPGGRLYAATNGVGHLQEIQALIKQVDLDADWWAAGRLFGLESGREQLARHFSEVTLHRYQDSLEVTEATPLLAYILSMKRSVVVEEQAVRLKHLIEDMIEDRGAIKIQKKPGILVDSGTMRHGIPGVKNPINTGTTRSL